MLATEDHGKTVRNASVNARRVMERNSGMLFIFDLFLIRNGHLFYNVSSHVHCVGEQTCVNEGAISCQCSPTQFVSSRSMAAVSVASPRSSSRTTPAQKGIKHALHSFSTTPTL